MPNNLRSTTADRLEAAVRNIAPSAAAAGFRDITEWICEVDPKEIDALTVEEIGWLKGYCEALNGTVAEVLDGFEVSADPLEYTGD